jgi:hypothetical protein
LISFSVIGARPLPSRLPEGFFKELGLRRSDNLEGSIRSAKRYGAPTPPKPPCKGHSVGVCGEGANDAPAPRQARLGILRTRVE